MRCWVVAVVMAGCALAQPGRQIFESQCALCHGQTGGGGRGPALNRPKLDLAPDDQALRALITDGRGDMPGAWQLHPDEVASVAVYVRQLGTLPPEALPGDSARGARVYASKGCAVCHMVNGRGEGYGPELTAVGARRNAAFLRQTILKPATTLPDSFLYVSAVPAAGPPVRGIRVNEDSFTIQVRDAGGHYFSFRKSELKSLERLAGQTPMPSFQGQFGAADLDDLVAYLAGLKGKP